MKLKSFRIKNFKSIIDTGWQNISPDNITCLIGQNESGKTSILEGLKAFYSGTISEDVLRSDLSLPEVSCMFSIPQGWLNQITDNPGTELKELLSRISVLELKRSWIADLTSVLTLSGDINDYLNSLEDAWRIYLNDVVVKLNEELVVVREAESAYTRLSDEENEIKTQLSQDTGKSFNFRFFSKKSNETGTLKSIHFPGLKNQLNEIKQQKEDLSKTLQDKNSIKKAGEKWQRLQEKNIQIDNQLKELSHKLEERHQKMTLLIRPIEDDSDTEWMEVLHNYRKARAERETVLSELDSHIAFSGYIIDGYNEEEAEQKVTEIIKSYKSHYNSEFLARKYYDYCPVFELFEDFGSLLPNRIDLEDIVNGNENVEGYKAARNFLSIARLDYAFFQQPSSRILKQKIENLNNTLTHNFQDFWQQSIGRNNKIQIQFELDHYSSSYAGKAGKPYLEFWIKDEGERLYPKQRSRGVRWFLSFYMELMASANNENKSIVLLVDEPGVSLHARAQEDVLKVFEVIKDKIQVIYTTHSPHLVEINKLHRVLAVQRDDMDNVKSTTRIIDPLELSTASPDTLTPLQSILGNPAGTEGFSSGNVNLIVNDTGSYYMLSAIILLTNYNGKVNIVPSTEVSAIPALCNILMGWGLDFAVLLFENESEVKLSEYLKSTIFQTEIAKKEIVIRMPGAFLNSEDILSTLDFKNHLLATREGITVPNSVYIKEKELPRNFLLSKFLSNVKAGKIKYSDFDEETVENFKMIINLLESLT